MDDIRVPMRVGTMNDIGNEPEDDQLDSQKEIYEKEAQIVINYRSLDDELTEVRL